LAALDVASAPEAGRRTPASPGEPVAPAAEELVDRVEAACAQAPVLVCLEDVRWADDASGLWDRLCAMASQQRLLLVATCRLVPRRDLVATLREHVREAGARVLSLGPLPEFAVSELVASLESGVPGPELLSLAARARGIRCTWARWWTPSGAKIACGWSNPAWCIRCP
jgi:hypothetical protein